MSKKKMTPEEEQQKVQKINKIVIIVLVFCFIYGFWKDFRGVSISDSDALHYLGKSYQYIQANVGQPKNIQAMLGGQQWQYDGFFINYQGSGYVSSVEIDVKSLKAGGCSVGDSLKSVESAMKKMDGGLVSNQADIYYTFSFKYEGRSYKLSCVANGSSATALVISG